LSFCSTRDQEKSGKTRGKRILGVRDGSGRFLDPSGSKSEKGFLVGGIQFMDIPLRLAPENNEKLHTLSEAQRCTPPTLQSDIGLL